MNIKKGDNIKIMSGNDKGKEGKVIAVFPVAERIVVEGTNMRKKHVRARRQGQKGEMIRIPAAFPASRAMIVCPKCSKTTRVKHAVNEAGIKMRICRSCGSEL
ncbi:MAG: 50S ribosomal protein L24 [bacterium]|nr:50S ribosomal protein L24 [bacterium]